MLRTATNDRCMRVLGVGKFPSDDQANINILDRVTFVEAFASDVLSLQRMERSGHVFIGFYDCVALFDDRFQFCVKSNLYDEFACRLTRRYVRDAMNNSSRTMMIHLLAQTHRLQPVESAEPPCFYKVYIFPALL